MPTGAEVVDAGDLVVSPGLVDTHVHVNEPGRTEWEGFDTATRAAAAGGVTTIVDMPLNSIPATTTVAALRREARAPRGRSVTSTSGSGAASCRATPASSTRSIDAGVRGFKCFLVPSGVDEFPAVDEDDLRQALPVLARRNVPLLVHAESPASIADRGLRMRIRSAITQSAIRSAIVRGVPRHAPAGSRGRGDPADGPPGGRVRRARVHIVHVSSAEGVGGDRRARRRRGVPITAETCPHYLTFAAEEIPDGATEFKCAPPIRDAAHRDALWDGLGAAARSDSDRDRSFAGAAGAEAPGGVGDFVRAWGGIASLELSLAGGPGPGASARGLRRSPTSRAG